MSEYAHAVDENTYVFRLRAKREDVKRCVFHYADRAVMEPVLTFSAVDMSLVRRDKIYDWFEITVRLAYQRVAYFFELDGGDETLYYLGDCFERDWEQNRSDYFQLPFNLRADRLAIPDWVHDAVVYNIFPDSFASAKRCISRESAHSVYDGQAINSLLGGTINGIRENLDYIKSLGCNCIYLNPVFAANSYHKYDIIDYKHIDPLRGTDEDFRALVNEAHSMGMRVIIDGVFNHISFQHPFFRDVLEKGRESKYYDWFYELPEHPKYPAPGEAADYLCFAYVPEMPKTNTANPELRDYFCGVGAYWVREFDVDGWRLDVANEVDDGFLRAFRSAVKREKPDALVIGEVWENALHYFNGCMMDSAMNYDFRRFCDQFMAKRSIDAAEFDTRVSSLIMRCQKQGLCAQLNLLDSHDVSRFLTLCGGDRDRMELAVLFQMTFPGMPSIFYGDEKGLAGKSEPEYRRPMEFDRVDSIEEVYRRFIALRLEHIALRRGEFRTVFTEKGVYGYELCHASERITVYMNSGSEETKIPVSGKILMKKNFRDGMLGENGYVITIA